MVILWKRYLLSAARCTIRFSQRFLAKAVCPHSERQIPPTTRVMFCFVMCVWVRPQADQQALPTTNAVSCFVLCVVCCVCVCVCVCECVRARARVCVCVVCVGTCMHILYTIEAGIHTGLKIESTSRLCLCLSVCRDVCLHACTLSTVYPW